MQYLKILSLFFLLWSGGLSTARQLNVSRAQDTETPRVQTNNAAQLSQVSQPPRLLIVDYAMAYPDEKAGVVRVFMEAGFEVDVRPYYPSMVERDASTYDAIVLMGGGDPGMSNQEVDLAINYVSRGKVLILAVPSDGPTGRGEGPIPACMTGTSSIRCLTG